MSYFIIKHYIGGVRELAKEFEPVRDKNTETPEILPLQQSGINNIIYIVLLNMEYLYG